ncbi:hypothetical protein [Amycolatopsis nigrescens]|uniref:hypothetical protein n=1 Tax=Amycolatopsis nigrescens TaxID=381445 RepID=UPI00036E4365|nr:hypothetical protein [Amycolatopsis nigrescens]
MIGRVLNLARTESKIEKGEDSGRFGRALDKFKGSVLEKVVDSLLVLAGSALVAFLAGIDPRTWWSETTMSFEAPVDRSEMRGGLDVALSGEAADDSAVWLLARNSSGWYPLQIATQAEQGKWQAKIEAQQIEASEFDLCVAVVGNDKSKQFGEHRAEFAARSMTDTDVQAEGASPNPCVHVLKR